jgi:hypothetical protein
MRKFPIRSIYILALSLVYSCNDDIHNLHKEELSDFAKEFLSMRMGSQNAMLDRQSGAINKSFQNLYGNFGGMMGGRIAEDSTGTAEPGDPGIPGDSTVREEPIDSVIYVDPWISCANITETVNEDGSITSIVDYGDGCEEGWADWKYRMWGRVISTYLYHNSFNGAVYKDVYYYNSEYDNYGGYYYYDSSEWEMNGISHYEGESAYDTSSLSFSGWYMYEDNTSYRWNDETYIYNGEGKTTYDNSQCVVEYADYEYSNGNDYYYHTAVLESLVMDYSCSSPMWMVRDAITEGDENSMVYIFTYVSGIEEIHYRKGEEEGHFIINYGDGECDNIITVTENGKTTVIDLSEDWLATGI